MLDEIDLRQGWRWLRWRGLVLILVFAMALIAFSAGVEVSAREDVGSSIMTRVYYSLGLFVFGGLDLGVPVGGPTWARVLLWIAFFAAPAITTSALVEAVIRAIGVERFRVRRMQGHVVIAGCGKLALLYLERLRKVNPRQGVVIVEKRPDNPHAPAVYSEYRAHVVFGDIVSPAVLSSLRLRLAERVVLVTGDDYVNLDAASRIARTAPHLASRTIVHVSDIRLLRLVESSGILSDAHKFNSYRTAANHLVETKLLPRFESTEPSDTVVLAGFGRFGQSVLDELQQRAPGKFSTVIIIDLEADLQTQVFDQQVGFAHGYRRHALENDVRHPGTWTRVESLLGEGEPVVAVGSGDDALNIRTAFRLAQRYPDAHIVVRCFHGSSFTEQISQECNFDAVSTADLLLESMHPDWFETGSLDAAPPTR